MTEQSIAAASGALTPHNPSGHIVFNAQQQAAVEDMKRWCDLGLKIREPYLLQGYAGTGKTTLVRELMNQVDIPISRIALVAPTNRAAKVLANKTGLHTQTIHRLIYLTVREELDYQRERLKMWEDSKNFTDLSDLLIKDAETDLEDLYWEEGGSGEPEDYAKWLERHRRMVLMYEGLELPDDPDLRLELFQGMRKDRIKEHRDKIRELLEEDLKVRKKEPAEILERYSLIIVDEASMVNETIGADLVSFGVPVIFVGDPFQLPPVKAKPYWHGKRAHSTLTKIERQKGPGAGIPLAGERIRQGMEVQRNESLEIFKPFSMSTDQLLEADQIICGTHKVRERTCRLVRKAKGYNTAHPQVGEKIVAVYNDRVNGIMNGELYIVTRVELKGSGEVVAMDLVDPYDKKVTDVLAWVKGFEGREFTAYLPDTYGKFWWGYCITCHQSQGSEWPHIIVNDDWFGSDQEQWLYTAITRASKKCSLVGKKKRT